MTPSLFIARLRAEFSDVTFSVKSKPVGPVLYADRQRIDVQFTPEEQMQLLLAAESSDDDVIEMFYNIIKQRIIEQLRSK